MMYQVVEKGMGVDWSLVRYAANALDKIRSKDEASKVAKAYLTNRNFNNVLTVDEKFRNLEAFMMTEDGLLLGVLDGKDQYMTYPKDVYGRNEQKTQVIHQKGEKILDRTYYQLQSMTEVSVKEVPGQTA